MISFRTIVLPTVAGNILKLNMMFDNAEQEEVRKEFEKLFEQPQEKYNGYAFTCMIELRGVFKILARFFRITRSR